MRRVTAIMNRVNPQGEEHRRNVLTFEGLSIDLDARIGTVDGQRVELYPNGLWFAYGDEHGREEALSADPFPEDVRTLNVPGEVFARTIAPGVFREVWDQAAERPDGFLGMFF